LSDPYTHFSIEERENLHQYLRDGIKVSKIAELLKRDKSSIYREIKRNSQKEYNAPRAERIANERRRCSYKCRKSRLFKSKGMEKFIINKLEVGWSPEMITAVWKSNHKEEKLSPSTIYRAVKQGKLAKIKVETHLRRRGKKQMHDRHKFDTIHPDHTIHERPKAVETRERFGDFEGDTVCGAPGKGGVVTLVDRKSRMLYAALCKTHGAKETYEKLVNALEGVPVRTLTLDNGSEFAKHRAIAKDLGIKVYFADPHAPWQRGTNERVNGDLRFWFPKGCDFTKVTDSELQYVVNLINSRPRKCLGWISPIQAKNLALKEFVQ
jgi:IS30 family transposase